MSASASPPVVGPHLVVRGGPEDGRVLAVDDAEVLIGSDAGCTACLDLPGVSPIHARLFLDADGVSVEDAHSRSGTFVNGQPVTEPRPLADGDLVQLGPPGAPDGVVLEARLGTQRPDVGAHASAAGEPAVRRPRRDDFVTEPPSIVPDAPRVPSVLPPAVPAAREPANQWRPLAAVAIGLVLGTGALAAYWKAQAPAPVIEVLLPPRVEVGQTLTVSGSGFGDDPAAHTVSVGDVLAKVLTAAPAQLTLEVPPALASVAPREVPVRVELRGRRSNAVHVEVFVAPRVRTLEPDVAQPGDEVTAVGDNLSAEAALSVAGADAEVLEGTSTKLRFRVPALEAAIGQSVPVAVRVGDHYARSVPLVIGRPPLVLGVDPARGVVGSRVVLTGRGLRPATGTPRAWFGDREALVFSASPDELRVAVPGVAALTGQGDVPVMVEVGGRTSPVPARFTVLRPSQARLIPRFAAEPGSTRDDTVVASELGPLLRLRGPGSEPSPAERAARIANVLNDLIRTAPGSRIELEVQGSDPVRLVAVGRPGSILEISGADAESYAAGSGRAIGAQELAEHWRALLQDYLDLFAAGRRPLALLSLYGPRAGSLDELFRMAARHGGGAGVPTSLVSPAPPDLLRSLARLAEAVPPRAGSGATVAVGEWVGTLSEPGQPERTVRLSLIARGTGLTGTLTTRARTIEVTLPLVEAAYEGGKLRLSWVSGDSPRTFAGSLERDRIEGDVSGGGARARLRLRLAG